MGASVPDYRLPQLDGLRAIAVGGVLVAHGTINAAQPIPVLPQLGDAGVRLFFVLSGFLITGTLVQQRAKAEALNLGRVGVWRAFYIRRALRIVPLSYLLLLAVWALGAHEIRDHGWWYFTYTSNIRLAMTRENGGLVGHFWSLAVEEQFYLFWPLAVLWLPRQWLLPFMLVSIGAAGLLRGFLVNAGQDWAAYVLTPSRLDALAAGGVLSLLAPATRSAVAWRLVAGAGVMGLLSTVPAVFIGAVAWEWMHVGLCAGLIARASEGFHGVAGATLTSAPVRYIGTISYGLYVVHYPVLGLLQYLQRLGLPIDLPDPGLWRVICIAACAVPLAAASWHFFESPINKLKRLFPYVQSAQPQHTTID